VSMRRLREHAAGASKKFDVGVERGQGSRASPELRDLRQFFGRQVVEVLVRGGRGLVRSATRRART